MAEVTLKSGNSPASGKKDCCQSGEGFCRSLFEQALDGILLTKPDGTILKANPQASRMLGMTEEELIQTERNGIVIQEDERLVTSLKEREQNAWVNNEVTFKRKDGSTFCGEISSKLFKDYDGEIKASVVIRDVTDRKKNKESLKEKTRLTMMLLDAFPCVALLMRPRTREIVASNKAAAQVGATPGKQCYRTWGRRETPCPFCLAPTTWDTGKAQHLDVEYKGTSWSAHWIPISDDLYMHFAFDITERKKTEQALIESEEKYRSLFTNMQNGFAYCKIASNEEGKPTDFVFIEVNDALEKLVGANRAEIIGRGSLEVNKGIRESSPEIFEVFSRIAFTGEREHFEVPVKQINKWLSVWAYGLKKGYFAAIIEDITEQKQAQEKLEGYSQGLEHTVAARTEELMETHERLLKAERFAAIGELAGMVGHDLRNPLTSIKNAVYYLSRKLGNTTDANEKMMFNVIDKSVDHANKIIASLLEYSKDISLEIEECTPKSLLDYVLLMAQIPPNVKIRDRTRDDPTIWVDSGKLERVFLNLIKNAIEAMPQGGTLDVTSRQVGENVEFAFTDTGTGISEANRERIFMPLFTTKAQGMGFGLAICKRIVEEHGGKITLETVIGKGTTFFITLPVEHKIKMASELENYVQIGASQN